ncbi:TetR/AcrR family transcriptional regulator [Levilactobacillus spicheri]|uniref:HTH tetR-type domain-containing protein n=1 Tax=Levilactobacillus spicheri TaxID=216463 RepID=A0A0F3RYV3_9LACO|nr:TetR/AcrR family transcriptional regulator [Levilactobacillus spicheri]KJW13982.1 hypothetical protein VC81_00470 [Levilactobacillus spicheri]
MTSTDKRVIRTREALGRAFEELALDHDYRDITITKLTKAAGINRKTFYLHYNSIDDLVDTFADVVTDQLTTIIRHHAIRDVLAHPGSLLDEFIVFSTKHSAIFNKVLFADDYSAFARRIERSLTSVLAQAIQASYTVKRPDALIVARFMIHNALSLYGYFAEQPGPFDRDAYKSYVSRLNLSGIRSFLT